MLLSKVNKVIRLELVKCLSNDYNSFMLLQIGKIKTYT